MIRLHLGCADIAMPGWINLDVEAGPCVDIADDARTLTSIPRASVDLIYASHLLDHMGRNEIDAVLTTWRQKLVPNGVLRLAVSDFGAITAEYAAGRPLNDLLGLLLGGHKDRFDTHGMAFDFRNLSEALCRNGFADVRRWDWRKTDHAEYDDFSRAYLPHMDTSGRLMSLNVEASAKSGIRTSPEWYALGDSHIWIFTQATGHPALFDDQRSVYSLDGRFQVNRLGPWTVRRLTSPEGRRTFDTALEGVSTRTKLILSFGEIDCRCLVIPEAMAQGRSIDAVCGGVAASYLTVASDLVRRGYTVYIWATPPPTGGPCYNREYPIQGTYEQRRQAAESLNGHLARMTGPVGARFAGIYDRLVHGNRTRTSFFSDYIHLNAAKVRPLIEEVLR